MSKKVTKASPKREAIWVVIGRAPGGILIERGPHGIRVVGPGDPPKDARFKTTVTITSTKRMSDATKKQIGKAVAKSIASKG